MNGKPRAYVEPEVDIGPAVCLATVVIMVCLIVVAFWQ